MLMSMKINRLEIENVKRIKAVKIEPTKNGLTVIGGKNNQGKTSVLDAIAWALGGDKYRPSSAQREGSVIPPHLYAVMSDGNNTMIVERKGKNSDLTVTDPSGKKGGQQLLNDFVEQLAINLPKFMQSTSKEKANTLLQIVGVGAQLADLERQDIELYNQRRTIGQIADQKKKFAKEQTYYPDAPKDPVSASDLIKQQQDILAKNGDNNRKRQNLQYLEGQASDIQRKIDELIEKQKYILIDLETAKKSALDLYDESTQQLEESIANIENINRKVRTNLDKEKAEEDAQHYVDQYSKLTIEIDNIRQKKIDLLNGAELPLPGLSVEDGELTYNGFKWDNMSGADQLKVSTAIVRKLNPECGFVLLDKLEQMDIDTLNEFGKWLEQEDLQAIATRVSTGEECSVIITDGYVEGQENMIIGVDLASGPDMSTETKWKAGEF
jgi:predicted ATP-dependent endonuclease of OLD family